MELFGLPTAILSQKGRTDLAWLYFTITSTPHKKRVWFILFSFSTLNWVFYMSRNWQKTACHYTEGRKAIALVCENQWDLNLPLCMQCTETWWMQPCLHYTLPSHFLSSRNNLWQWKNINHWHRQCLSPYWLFVAPQTSGNFNGPVLLSETLAKLKIPDFQTLDLQTICGPWHHSAWCTP